MGVALPGCQFSRPLRQQTLLANDIARLAAMRSLAHHLIASAMHACGVQPGGDSTTRQASSRAGGAARRNLTVGRGACGGLA